MHEQAPLELIRGDSPDVRASVIWLHGLGADGYDFAPVVDMLNLAQVRFILPHAPSMAVTRNNGYVMPAWYDLFAPSESQQEDLVGLTRSEDYLNSLIENEIKRGIAATRYPKKLAGVLALSTYLPLKATLAKQAHAANLSTPIFMAHGRADDIISLDRALASRFSLQESGFTVQWYEYAMAHSVCAEEINDIRLFLTGLLQQDLVE